MNEKMLSDLKDMQFIMTSKMKDQLMRLIVIKQTLDNKEIFLSSKEQIILKKEFASLLKEFKKEFQTHNQVQIQIIRTYLGINKKIRDKQVIN